MNGLMSVALGSLVPGSGLWGSREKIPKAQPIEIGISDLDRPMQLQRRLPEETLKRTYPWIVQREPESHLGFLVDRLSQVITERHLVFGASFKDETTLDELKRRRIQTMDSGPIVRGRDVSVIQREFGLTSLRRGSNKNQPRVVVARHLLEHVYDFNSFFGSLREMIGDDGFALIEVPDTLPALSNLDFSELWDEHISYFTIDSLVSVLEAFSFSVLDAGTCVGDGEHVLFAIVQVAPEPRSQRAVSSKSPYLAIRYLDSLVKERQRSRQLSERLSQGLVIYGANHRASNFIDIFIPDRLPLWVVDDDVRKQGMWMSSRAVQISSPSDRNLPLGAPVLVALNEMRFDALLEERPPLLTQAVAKGTVMDFSFLYGL